MDDMFYYNELYDIYANLLTDKQKAYYEDYYFNNLSLGEMAINYNVSRNAIFKQLKITVSKLLEFEEKLGFWGKIKKFDEIVSKSSDKDIKVKFDNLF